MGSLIGISSVVPVREGPPSLDVFARERSFEMMVEAVIDYAIFQLDPEGFVATWNLGAKRIKGYKGTEIIGKHFSIFYPVEALATGLPAGELEIAAEDGRYEGQGWRVRKDGSTFWAHVVITALRNAEGSLVGFTKVTQDLTEKRATERSLRDVHTRQTTRLTSELVASDSHLSHVLDASIFVAIVATDLKGIVTTFNRGAESMLGYSADEIVGKYTPLLFHRAEEVARRGQILGEVLGRPIYGLDALTSSIGVAKYERSEWTYVHKNGHELIVDLSLSIITGGRGQAIGYLAVSEDVTERQRTLTDLAASYAHVNSVLECMSDSVVKIGADWTIRYGNRKAFEGITDLKIGSDYWSSFPEVLGTPTEEKLHRAMRDRTVVKYEIYYAPYGRWYRSTAFPAEDGLTLFFSDITEEKEMQDRLELEQLLREKRIEALSHMAGGLAHEITNPLAIIHGRAMGLRDAAQGAAPVAALEIQGACDDILKTANRALNILRGLRGFARDAAKDPMAFASIRDIVAECMEIQGSRFESHSVEVQIDLPADLPLVLCRATQIGQILTNLLNNAFDAIVQSNSAPRWISIAAETSETALTIGVADSGPGIEDHFKAHLMEPFFTTKEMGMGMGVGLSLSRAIAQDHGGTLMLCSDTVHTCFRLVLPIATQEMEDHKEPVLSGVTY